MYGFRCTSTVTKNRLPVMMLSTLVTIAFYLLVVFYMRIPRVARYKERKNAKNVSRCRGTTSYTDRKNTSKIMKTTFFVLPPRAATPFPWNKKREQKYSLQKQKANETKTTKMIKRPMINKHVKKQIDPGSRPCSTARHLLPLFVSQHPTGTALRHSHHILLTRTTGNWRSDRPSHSCE